MKIRSFAYGVLAATVVSTLSMPTAMASFSTETAPGRQAVGSTTGVSQIPATLEGLEAARTGKYGQLSAEDKLGLDAAGNEIRQLIRKYTDLSGLNEQERVRLFNAQETVLAIVSGLKRNQLVCTYRANAGTRFKTKHCVSRDIADAQRRAAREDLRGMQSALCPYGENAGCMTEMQRVNSQGEAQPTSYMGGP